GLKFGDPANDGIPPDTNAAAGPSSIIETVNTSMRLFDKSGNVLASQTAVNFFGITNTNNTVTDPYVIFDEYAQRFVIYFIDVDFSGNTALLHVAVSDDANPTSFTTGWTEKQAINEALTVGSTATWGDFPRFGYNADAWVITENQFGFSSGFQGIGVY